MIDPIIDEEDLAVLNEQVVNLMNQQQRQEVIQQENIVKYKPYTEKVKADNDALVKKFDEDNKALKKYIIILRQFQRWEKDEKFNEKEKKKKELKEKEEQEFENLKKSMKEEKRRRRANPIYGGLKHLSPDKRKKWNNDDSEMNENDPSKVPHIFTVSSDKHLKFYSVLDCSLITDFGEIDSERVNVCIVSPNQEWVFTGGQESGLKKFSIKDQKLLKDFGKITDGSITSIAITDDSDFLYIGGSDKSLKKIDLRVDEIAHSVSDVHESGVLNIQQCSKLGKLFTSGGDGTIKQFNMEDLASETKEFKPAHEGIVQSMCITPNLKYLITAGWDKHIKMWEIFSHELIKDLGNAHKDVILTMALSKNGEWLFTGSSDQTIKKWVLKNSGIELFYDFGKQSAVYAMALGLDGRHLFTAGTDKTLKQWNIRNCRLVKDFGMIHDDTITCMAIANLSKAFNTEHSSSKIVRQESAKYEDENNDENADNNDGEKINLGEEAQIENDEE